MMLSYKKLANTSLLGIASRIAGLLIGFAVTVVLARSLGSTGYGLYTFALSSVMLVGIPVQAGLHTLIVRDTVRYSVDEENSKVLGLWFWSIALLLFYSTTVAILLTASTGLLSKLFSREQVGVLEASVFLMCTISLSAISGAMLSGVKRPALGVFTHQACRQVFLLCGLGGSALVGFSLTPSSSIFIHSVSAVLTAMLAIFVLATVSKDLIKKPIKYELDVKAWTGELFPLSIAATFNVIFTTTDTLMLAHFFPDTVGPYQVATRMASLSIIVFSAVTMVLQPSIAKSWHQGDTVTLERTTHVATALGILAAIPMVLIVWAFGEEILALVFGEEYHAAYYPMVILGFGQLLNCFSGPVGEILTTCKEQKLVMRTLMFTVVLNVLLNLMLIPQFGVRGAAFATFSSILFRNIVFWIMVKRKFRIDASGVAVVQKISKLFWGKR